MMNAIVRRTMTTIVLAVTAVSVSGCSYNTFVSQEEAIKQQFAEIQNQLQRRNDLIPNLVATVEGTAKQERDVFGQIAESRAKAGRRHDATADDRSGESADGGARPADRDRGELSAVEVERIVQPADGRPVEHRESDRRRAHALQRESPGVQRAAPQIPFEHSPPASSASRTPIRSSTHHPQRRKCRP
jgi:hypothetical protein